MKKFTKAIGVMLVVAMLATVLSVMSFAVEPGEITVFKAPDRTVLYEEYDTVDKDAFCNPVGMVLHMANEDGSTKEINCDMYNTEIVVEGYVLGENTADVYYYDEAADEVYMTTTTVTVEKNPVQSIEITKMPTKTEYILEESILSKEDFSLEEYIDENAEELEAMLSETGMEMTAEELKAMIKANPEMEKLIVDIIFQFADDRFMLDTTGMEIKVTYIDGTSEVLTDEDLFNTYGEYMFPIEAGQADDEIVEGENRMYVEVMGKRTYFNVTVKKAPVVPEEKPPVETPKENPKNPVIPNTDGASVAAVAVIALMSACGVALIPSKKER